MRANKGTRFSCLWLAPLMMLGMVACCCPKPEAVSVPKPTMAEEEQAKPATAQLDAAEAGDKKWQPEDDAKFSALISTLHPEIRLRLAIDLARRLNDRKLTPVHKRPTPGRVVCPGLCDSGVKKTTTQTVPSVPSVPSVPRATGKTDAK